MNADRIAEMNASANGTPPVDEIPLDEVIGPDAHPFALNGPYGPQVVDAAPVPAQEPEKAADHRPGTAARLDAITDALALLNGEIAAVGDQVALECDHKGCERVHRGADNEPLSRVRLHAFGMDWTHERGGKDYCPLHDPKALAVVLAGGAS